MPFRLSVPAGDTARVGLGDVVGRGRDAVILDHGEGLVLRRPLSTRMMDVEARVMAWVHEHGYPSPRLVAPKVRAFIAALERALGELST